MNCNPIPDIFDAIRVSKNSSLILRVSRDNLYIWLSAVDICYLLQNALAPMREGLEYDNST